MNVEVLSASNRFIVDNFVILDAELQFGVINSKYPYEKINNASIYLHEEWKTLYKAYYEPNRFSMKPKEVLKLLSDPRKLNRNCNALGYLHAANLDWFAMIADSLIGLRNSTRDSNLGGMNLVVRHWDSLLFRKIWRNYFFEYEKLKLLLANDYLPLMEEWEEIRTEDNASVRIYPYSRYLNLKNRPSQLFVGVPVYNASQNLIRCLDSLLRQTDVDIAVAIVDNASTDNTLDIAIEYANLDERVVVFRNAVNVGRIENWNRCLSYAVGEYFKLVMVNDELITNCCSSLVAGLNADQNLVMVACGAYFITNDEKCRLDLISQTDINLSSSDTVSTLIEQSNICGGPTAQMFRLALIRSYNLEYDLRFDWAADYDFSLRYIETTRGNFYYIARPLYRFYANLVRNFSNTPMSVRYMEEWNVRFAALLERSYKSDDKLLNRIENRFIELHNYCQHQAFDCSDSIRLYTLLEFVIQQLALMKNKYLLPGGLGNSFDLQLLSEIALKESPVSYEPAPDKFSYHDWLARQRWSQSAVARLAARVETAGPTPSVHLLMIADPADGEAMAITLDSLGVQILVNWHLTVLSPAPCPDPLFETLPVLSWMQFADANALPATLEAVIASVDADWRCMCLPGMVFETSFTLLLAAMTQRHPQWQFIYFDEDRIGKNGQFTEPMLKPEPSIDLLRSTCYVGNSCLIYRDLWKRINSIKTQPTLLFNYVMALSCYEIFGEKAIGHVDEIMFHQPSAPSINLEEYEMAAMVLLREHLRQQGIKAEVSLGLVEGSFFVDYPLLCTPLVSIIIPTKDRLELLQPCVESLLEKTGYSNYEVIIIDNCSTDSETLKYFAQLPTIDSRIRVLSYPQQYNYAAINNFATNHALGDYLLLLNNDTVILQENWLDRLVAIGLRDDVGAVGCRLLYADQRVQHAGVILGLNGIAEHIGIGLPMTEPGYLNRGQLTQNFSAVTAACMLVRKDLFLEVGGLDEKDFAILYNDIDLCLKIRERGYRIVWTPFVTLVHHGNSSLKAEHDAIREKRNQHSRKAFIKKWLHRLGNDPAYNRHLSLRQREWMINGEFDVSWHPDFESLPRIVAHPPDEMGVGQYRVIGPIKELTQGEMICSFMLPALNSDKRFLPSVPELARAKPTVLFLQNAFTEFHIEHLEDYAEFLPDVFRVFGQDDIVFSVPQKSAARKHFGKDTKARVRKAVSLCHRAIVTTEPIAEAMRGMVDDIRVMPNYLERSRWGDLQPPRNERRKLRVGWAGAQQHQGDLEFILPVVEATANEVDWIFMGMCPPKLRYHVAEAHPAVAFDEYPAELAKLDLDLAIAPLELNRFNAAKSNLRLLEYGAVGYPVIATDILPYQGAPVTRVPNNPQAWIKAIREHIHELEATRTAGERLRQWVLSDWMLDQHLGEWLRALLPD